NVDPNLMRPYIGLGTLNAQAQVGNNHYDSLQISATKRYSHGFTAQGVYTFSKLYRQTENNGPFFYNWKDYTGFRANGDRDHVANINYSYDVPGISQFLGKKAVVKQVTDGWAFAHVISFLGTRYSSPLATATSPQGSFSVQYANNTSSVANMNAIFTGSPDI